MQGEMNISGIIEAARDSGKRVVEALIVMPTFARRLNSSKPSS